MLPEGLLDELKRSEGFSATPYRDTVGKLTIGYGTLIEDGISEVEAEFLLQHRAEIVWKELLAAKPFISGLSVNRQRAFADMAYNLGVPGLLKFQNMWTAAEAGDWPEARAQALDSRWAKQVGNRADRIADTLLNG